MISVGQGLVSDIICCVYQRFLKHSRDNSSRFKKISGKFSLSALNGDGYQVLGGDNLQDDPGKVYTFPKSLVFSL